MGINMNPKTELIQKEYDLLLSHIKELKEIKNQDTTNFYSNLSYLQQNNLDKLDKSFIYSLVEWFTVTCNFILTESFFKDSDEKYNQLKDFIQSKLKSIKETSYNV